MSSAVTGFLLALIAAYGVFLVYTAVVFGWRGIGISPGIARRRQRTSLREFLVQKTVRLAPVDAGVRLREVEREELRKIAGERVLPGAVEVVRGPVLGHGHVLVPVESSKHTGFSEGRQVPETDWSFRP